MAEHKKCLFIFRRDLRLDDNTALIAALKASREVIPCFIFDPRQVGDQPYRSQFAIDFMVGSLIDLEAQLKARGANLFIFEGQAHEVLEALIKRENIDAVYVNADYTPFSRQRDELLARLSLEFKVQFHSFHDALLNPPDTVKKNDGGVYTIFTPYCRKAMTYEVAKPVPNKHANYYHDSIKFEDRSLLESLSGHLTQVKYHSYGRRCSLNILKDLTSFNHYDEERNFPHLQATTRLSAHHKFGTCSIREAYHAIKNQLGIDHALIRELYWRDFFTQIGYHFPRVLGQCFQKQYEGIKWNNDHQKFEAWCKGMTGFPIVDAGMRELNATGFMHNRVRMITASFLVKDLHIDWRWGEKYFAQKLVDYDPLVNNGNWQWAASTGCDAQPYFRIFNPWLQQERFDPQGLYIKQWIPELDAKYYPKPMLDHKLESQGAIVAFKRMKPS